MNEPTHDHRLRARALRMAANAVLASAYSIESAGEMSAEVTEMKQIAADLLARAKHREEMAEHSAKE